MLPRFLHPNPAVGKTITLNEEAARHAKALRLRAGDAIHIFDGMGKEYEATVKATGKTFVAEIISQTGARNPKREIILAFSCPKGERLDWLVEKATELGVSRLIPLKTARTVVIPKENKLSRLQRLAEDAARQSGRATIPEVTHLMALEDALKLDADVKLVLDPEGKPLRDVTGSSGSVLCIVGPEGGLTEEELQACVMAKCALASLGNMILRIETAAITSCAIIVNG